MRDSVRFMEETSLKTIPGTVRQHSADRVEITLEDGQMLHVSPSRIHGKAEDGTNVRILVYVPGSQVDGGEKVSQALLNELLGQPKP